MPLIPRSDLSGEFRAWRERGRGRGERGLLRGRGRGELGLWRGRGRGERGLWRRRGREELGWKE